jgi:thiol-disulfide isomerase/thioredoxin
MPVYICGDGKTEIDLRMTVYDFRLMKSFIAILLFMLPLLATAQDRYVPTVGSKLLSLAGQDMLTGKVVDIEFANSPAYTLFHFWKSNSDSSIKTFAQLQQFVAKNKSKLVTYGFPFEYKKDIPQAKELSSKYKLNWPQLLQYRQPNGAAVVDVLVITDFPTFILIDREGVILVRSNALEDVEALLEKLK